VDAYVRPEGELGTAHFDFKVAHKGGEPCPICGCTIERVPVQNAAPASAPSASVQVAASEIKAGDGWI
jgi:formamidopyrimidine-DNA glycosylase